MHTRRNVNRPWRIAVRSMEQVRFYRSCGEGGLTGTVGASCGVDVGIASGMETRRPGGAGQRQRSRLCAKHDSPPGRPLRQSASRYASQETHEPETGRDNADIPL